MIAITEPRTSRTRLAAWAILTLVGLLVQIATMPAARAQENAQQSPQQNPLPSALPPLNITAQYSVFASGFRALHAAADMRRNDETYNTRITIRTDGLLKKLAPWDGVLYSYGSVRADDLLAPKEHRFDNTWRGSTKTTRQIYDDHGQLTHVETIEKDHPDENKEPEAALTIDTTDILSAAMQALRTADATGTCNSTHAVFDGKRRFDLVFTEKRRETLKKSRYSGFEGNVMRCAVEIVPVAGHWRDKPRGWMSIQEQSREHGQLPLIWFGRIPTGVDGELGPHVPVKLQVKTNYGTLLLHLEKYEQIQEDHASDPATK